MLEVFLIIIGLIVIWSLGSVILSLLIILLVIVLIFPGVYSMITGAPFVPTNKRRIDVIMKFGSFRKSDRVVELGCGDGRIIRKISKLGVKEAVGYEFSLPTYLFALLKKYVNKGKEKLIFGNFWHFDHSDVDVIICFLSDRSMKEFKKRVWPTLKRGTKVISNEYELPGVKPVAVERRVYLYVKG